MCWIVLVKLMNMFAFLIQFLNKKGLFIRHTQCLGCWLPDHQAVSSYSIEYTHASYQNNMNPIRLKRVLFRQQYSPMGKPSRHVFSPWGGASAMCTHIFVAFSRQFSLSRSCQASATASGKSLPPEAEAASSQVFISFTDGVKSWTRVTKLDSWGGWSRYSMRARWTSDFSLATISVGEERDWSKHLDYLCYTYTIIYYHILTDDRISITTYMMMSSNRNIFRVSGHLCGEFTGPRWIPHTMANHAELWCFVWSASE